MKIRNVFIFGLTFCFFFCSLIPSVSAASLDSPFINILPSSSYSIRYGSGEYKDSPYPGGENSYGTQTIIKWDIFNLPANIYSFDIFIYCSAPISSLRFGVDGNSTSDYADLVGSYDGVYQFKCGRIVDIDREVMIRFGVTSEDSYIFEVYAVYGTYLNISVPLSNVNASVWTRYFDRSGDYPYLQQEFYSNFNGNPRNTSFHIHKIHNNSYELSKVIVQCEFFLENIEYTKLDKINLLLKTRVLTDATCTIYLNGYQEVVEVTADIYDTHDSTSSNDSINDWNSSIVSVTADLSPYDIIPYGSNITFNFILEPIPLDMNNDRVDFEILSGYYFPLIEDVPWYQTFWNWLRSPIDRIIDLLSNMGEDSSGAIEENSQDLTDQATVMDELNEQLEVVVKPTVDPAELVESNISFTDTSLTVMTGLVDNDIITPILLVLCTLALLGYILFGSKGG